MDAWRIGERRSGGSDSRHAGDPVAKPSSALALGRADEQRRAAAVDAGPLCAKELRVQLKEALKTVTSPDLLLRSPLLHLRVVVAGAGGARSDLQRARALAAYLREQAEAFQCSPPDRVLSRVLERAYFDPAVKQRAAADDLGMGYSTFRRHLAAAIHRLTEVIYQDERRARGM